jgi:predicted DNA binding CopG/RHH family protein
MKKSKKKNLKPIPSFKSEDEERDFWDKADSTEYFDFSNAAKVKFPNLKFSTESISIRLPKSLLDNIKIIANKKDVPYQSLIKIYLSDRVSEERSKNYL